MDKFKVLDLFSGIGGFSLGLERTGGFKTVAFCEIEEFPRKVLIKHWPGVPIYEDVRELTAERLLSDGIRPDVITGGFPCQDISVAGKQGGITAKRSGLWTELARLIGEIRPRYAIVENVTALLSGERGRWFQRVLGDLAEIGYDTEWHCIRAYELGIPQTRTRVWIIAYPSLSSGKPLFHKNTINVKGNYQGVDVQSREYADLNNEDCGKGSLPILGNGIWPEIPHRERIGTDGRLSGGVDRYKGLGNAVVPQIPELIGRAILEAEHGGMCE